VEEEELAKKKKKEKEDIEALRRAAEADPAVKACRQRSDAK